MILVFDFTGAFGQFHLHPETSQGNKKDVSRRIL
jgi:hypothetical protein